MEKILKAYSFKSFRNWITIICFLFTFQSFAGLKLKSSDVQIKGTLVRWNEKLNLAWVFHEGKMVRVPISSLKGYSKKTYKRLKAGKVVVAHIKLKLNKSKIKTEKLKKSGKI